MQSQLPLAGYGECPNCKYVGKLRHDERSETPNLSITDFVIGCLLFLFAILPGVLWLLWCLAVRRKTTRFCRCARCGFEHVIPLSENEYLKKLDAIDAAKKE